MLSQAMEPSLELTTPEIVAMTDYGVKLRYDNDFWPTQSEAADAVAIAEQVRDAVLALVPEEVRP